MAILPTTTTTTMRGKVGETAVAVSSVSSSSDGISRHHNHHHNPREESAREIVRRKRETFLAQMAVDVRKEEIDKLESDADRVMRSAMSKLFREEPDVREVIKLKAIYELLETVTDKCEDVANVIEGIILENS